jgi:hypothetical protein
VTLTSLHGVISQRMQHFKTTYLHCST